MAGMFKDILKETAKEMPTRMAIAAAETVLYSIAENEAERKKQENEFFKKVLRILVDGSSAQNVYYINVDYKDCLFSKKKRKYTYKVFRADEKIAYIGRHNNNGIRFFSFNGTKLYSIREYKPILFGFLNNWNNRNIYRIVKGRRSVGEITVKNEKETFFKYRELIEIKLFDGWIVDYDDRNHYFMVRDHEGIAVFECLSKPMKYTVAHYIVVRQQEYEQLAVMMGMWLLERGNPTYVDY